MNVGYGLICSRLYVSVGALSPTHIIIKAKTGGLKKGSHRSVMTNMFGKEINTTASLNFGASLDILARLMQSHGENPAWKADLDSVKQLVADQ